jgi:hypothetical protein
MMVVALQIGNAAPPLLAAYVSMSAVQAERGGNSRPPLSAFAYRPCLVSRNGA